MQLPIAPTAPTAPNAARRAWLVAQARPLIALAGVGTAAALLSACGSAPVQTTARRSSPRGASAGLSAEERRAQAILNGAGDAPTVAAGRSAPPPVAVVQPLNLQAQYRETAVARAMLTVNTPYTYGGNTLDSGFDCSGLVQFVLQDLGARRLPRTTAQWAQASLPVDDAALRRGDLVFFNTTGSAYSHMGIFVGDGQFVHAPSSGGRVRKEALTNRYFAARYNGARTVFNA